MNTQNEKLIEALYDFASRCQRPDGSYYGTAGQCRKGKEVGAEEGKAEKKSKVTKAQAAALKAAKEEKDTIFSAGGNREEDAEIADFILKRFASDPELAEAYKALGDDVLKGLEESEDESVKKAVEEGLYKNEKEAREALKNIETYEGEVPRSYGDSDREALETVGTGPIAMYMWYNNVGSYGEYDTVESVKENIEEVTAGEDGLAEEVRRNGAEAFNSRFHNAW